VQAIKKILCPIDFSQPSKEAFAFAKQLAERFHAELELLYVAPGINETYVALLPDFPESGIYRSDDLASDFNSFTDDWTGNLKKVIRTGPAYLEIVKYAEESNTDLIVMGSREHSQIERIFIGSTGERVARHSHCPTLSLRKSTNRFPIQKILVPVDYSERCYAVLPMVALLAKGFGAEVDFLHIIESDRDAKEDRSTGNEYFDLLKEKLSEEWQTPQAFDQIKTKKYIQSSPDHPGQAIVEFAREQNVDLIVMASHGKTGLVKMLMGNVTEKVLRISDIPLLSVNSSDQ